jgi:nicotinate-nucleotide adenylyltransferase
LKPATGSLRGNAVAGLRVGLLGGSFNPAHAGHRHISLLALKLLQLDELWWVVSPQNPLKSTADMAPFAKRLEQARRTANHPRIRVTAIEARLNTRYTADTLHALRKRFPHTRFVWIMGADNLAQIPHWERWTEIFGQVPIAVFDRATYSFRALAGKAARRFANRRIDTRHAVDLADLRPPAWVYFHARRHPASASSIRARYAEARSLPKHG